MECSAPGIWHAGAPAIVTEFIPDIEETLVHAKEDARVLLEKTIRKRRQKGTDNPGKGRGKQEIRVHHDAPGETINKQD